METKPDRSVSYVAEQPHMCRSCGLCEGICPVNAIQLHHNKYGQQIPSVDLNLCVQCGLCEKYCVGRHAKSRRSDPVGPHIAIYLAYSTDHHARALGASGGVASTLARFALEKQICKKVVTLGGTNPLDPTPMTLTKSADFIDSVYSSKYISHPIARLVTDFDEDTIVTGLPCVVESIRSYTSKPLLFGLFCSKVNTKSLLEDLSYRNHHDVSDLSSISYRTGKWPGRVEMQFNAHTVSYPLNRSIYTAISNSYYYVNQGCMLCEDYFSSDSDLSFGDPWGISLEDDFASGATVVIVRTQRGEALMNRAVNDKWLIACPLDIHTMLRGHLQGIYAKRIPLPYRRKIFQSHGCILPDSPDNAHTSMTAALLDNYYIRNNYTVKLLGKFARIRNLPDWHIFVSRYIVLAITKFYIKFIKLYRNVCDIYE